VRVYGTSQNLASGSQFVLCAFTGSIAAGLRSLCNFEQTTEAQALNHLGCQRALNLKKQAVNDSGQVASILAGFHLLAVVEVNAN
jgi:hypothetical protein